MKLQQYTEIFDQVLVAEANAIEEARIRLNKGQGHKSIEKLVKILEVLHTSGGSLVFSGVGKSGIVAQKLSSTFASLGLSSYFLHPVEALHGDLGRMSKIDAIVFISKSGSTEELLKLIPYLPLNQSVMIGLLGQVFSPLADKCSLVFDCSVEKEACLNNQAPTTSTAVAMAMGDAMAMVYEKMIGLSKENFAMTHPGGMLGKSLRLKVKDLMIPAVHCPILPLEATFQDLILKMTEIPLGIGIILGDHSQLLGIIVEGDIRRILTKKKNIDLQSAVKEFLNLNPVKVGSSDLAYDALVLMEDRITPISVLPVVDEGIFTGVIRLHDLLKEGLLFHR